MENTDTRIQFTKSRFHKAMTKLLGEKQIGFITVKELCEAAGINRGTFYLHYAKPIDVLHEMEQELVNKALGDKLEEEKWNRNSLIHALLILLQDQPSSRVIMGHNGDPQFLRKVSEIMYTRIGALWKEQHPEASEEEIRFTFEYLFAGSTAVIKQWIDSPDPMPVEKMAKRLSVYSEGVLNILNTGGEE